MQMVMQSIVLAALLAPAAGASGGLRATSAATSGAAGQLTADAPLRGEAHRSAILALVEDMPPKVEGAIQALASESKQIATNPTKAESGASGGSYLTRVVLHRPKSSAHFRVRRHHGLLAGPLAHDLFSLLHALWGQLLYGLEREAGRDQEGVLHGLRLLLPLQLLCRGSGRRDPGHHHGREDRPLQRGHWRRVLRAGGMARARGGGRGTGGRARSIEK